MKRILVTLSAIALIAFAAQAQAAAGDMYAGVKAGVNISNVGGSDAPDNTSSRTGFQGGLFIGKHMNDQFGFRVEGLYVQKGAKGKASSSSSTEVTEKIDYIEFPILFVYDIKNTEKMGFNLFAGPTLGFNMSAKVEDTDIKDNIQSFEFGGAIGAGVEKKMAGGKAIGLDVRYSMGATTVAKDITVGSTTTSPDIKNHGVGIMASYSIPLGSSK